MALCFGSDFVILVVKGGLQVACMKSPLETLTMLCISRFDTTTCQVILPRSSSTVKDNIVYILRTGFDNTEVRYIEAGAVLAGGRSQLPPGALALPQRPQLSSMHS